MALTRLQMANEVLDNIGRSGAGTTQSGSTLANMAIRWLNRAQIITARELDIFYKEATANSTASQKTYAFPSDLGQLFTIRLENGLNSSKLVCVMPWEFDHIAPRPASESIAQPYYYVPDRVGATFEPYPIPDAIYLMRIRYSVWPTDLSSDSQTSDLSAAVEVDDVLIDLATSYGFMYLQELIDSGTWKKSAETKIKTLRKDFNYWPDWEPIARGFRAEYTTLRSQYWNDPFVVNI